MALVIGTVGTNHFPAIGNPQTAAGDAIIGSPASTLGIPNPQPTAAAGCLGKFSVNGFVVGGAGGSSGSALLDLCTWGNKDIVTNINGSNTGIAASINQNGRIVLQSPTGMPITIAGDAATLAALGFTAGTTN